MSKGKGSTARYKAMLADLALRANYALYSGDHTNPYPVDDKRHDRFTATLRHKIALDADFEDTLEMMGCDTSTLVRRVYENPGPVESLEVLGERWRAQHVEEIKQRAPWDDSWDD